MKMRMPDLQLDVVVSELFAENCYIARLADRDDCLIFDPGLDPEEILQRIAQSRLTPAAIINTHGHADHIAGNESLKRVWRDCPLIIGEEDAPKLSDPALNLSAAFGVGLTSPPADRLVREGDIVSAAGFDLHVLETPGHSVGHVVFLWKGASPWVVFGGDVLFAGSIGRTDFPDGSMRDLAAAIHRKLFILPDDTIVLPGHGPSTTIGEEKRSNPFVGAPAGWRPAAQ